MSSPHTLRVEHLEQPLGIGVRRPRLSWQLPAGVTEQLAREVALDDGTTTGRVEGADNVLVAWPGGDLGSRERRSARVRVWTDHGESDWSEPVTLEAGLLDPADWSSAWVEPVEHGVHRAGARPAYLLRGEVVLDRPVVRARLYAAARGIYTLHLNGQRVGDVELAPGYTEYAARTLVQTYDVTDLLVPGANAIGAVLADGWYRGQVGMLRAADQFGERTALLAQLHLDHEDGSTTVVGTGPDWRSTTSHVLVADLIEGQHEDHRLLRPGWDLPGHGVTGWDEVVVVDHGHAHLVHPVAPPVRAVEELRPVSVTTVPGGQVFDLGQNVNGWVRLRDLGPTGTELTLTHAEVLGPDGDVTTDHLKPADIPFIEGELTAGMVDRVVSSGQEGDVFEPRLTTHGFQHVRVEGHPGVLTADDVTGVVVHTDLRRTGWFGCSDPRLEALHDAAVWSFRGNACDIPTDCPTRERAGWTGDWQLYVPTATFLYDVAGFSAKWLQDLTVGQWDNGVIGNMAPMPPAERVGMLEHVNGSAGWGDAAVLVPWEIYLEHGDVRLLEEQWPSMVAWLGFVERTAREQRHPSRVEAAPVAAPHEEYVWDAGFHWGEWLVPGEDLSDFGAFIAADKSDVATAFYARSTQVASEVARLLGRDAEAERYELLSTSVVDAWRTEFIDGDGVLRPETQANLVRALAFGLVPEELRQATVDRLDALVRANDTHLATGFLATPDLLPVLADGGHLDTAYDLLLQDTPPSWLTMIVRGATTVWERWEGIDADGVPHESLNHYSKGAVVSFLHRHVAGLQRTSPTWRTFRVEPRPGGGLTWASAEHDSPHGRVASSWQLEGEVLSLSVTVPPGCRAEVVLPTGETHLVGPGSHHWASVVTGEVLGSVG